MQNQPPLHLRWETVSGCGCVARKLSLSDQWGGEIQMEGQVQGKETAAAQGKKDEVRFGPGWDA